MGVDSYSPAPVSRLASTEDSTPVERRELTFCSEEVGRSRAVLRTG